MISVGNFISFHSGKYFSLFAVISGFRNNTGIEPLYSPKGLAPNICDQIYETNDSYFDQGGPGISWLRVDLIHASLSHMRINHDNLSLSVHIVLEKMTFLEKQLGKS
ncbi:hypothetical protein ACFLU6_14155 [Acidobacteriota bacterium]